MRAAVVIAWVTHCLHLNNSARQNIDRIANIFSSHIEPFLKTLG
jgi:hypothetical protein